ncbi:MAG TPA: alpha/beta hydrolase [Acidimicrobiales bacterium]|nr:alpha/beta hydrolase [Acidimicrobiales bacterium]
MTAARVVLVHGAWHGSWCWDPVLDRLEGCDVVAVDLPSTLSADATFEDDVAVVRDVVSGPTVLCGHSYGGVVIGAAAAHDDVAHCVFLCAFAQEDGAERIGVDASLFSALRFDGAITTIDPALANQAFYADVHPDLAAAAITKLRPQVLAATGATAGIGAWRSKPSTYVVCTEDQAIAPDAQRGMAAGCDEVVEWACSHSPMLSKPDDVAALLRRVAGS